MEKKDKRICGNCKNFSELYEKRNGVFVRFGIGVCKYGLVIRAVEVLEQGCYFHKKREIENEKRKRKIRGDNLRG